MLHLVKKSFISVLLVTLALFLSSFLAAYYLVEAGAGQNVSGFAWSDNTGWISFNSSSDGSGVDYGVNIDPASGVFSGYGWSENIGWIDFAPSSGYPETPNHGAMKEGNDVTGWAQALSADGLGWDGWIKMSGSWTNGVTINPATGAFSGYAWGSDVVGWIDFDPALTEVTFNQPECSDAIDNNANGWIDAADPGCVSGSVEGNDPVYECSDGIDNDLNGLIDGNDIAQCSSITDNMEAPDFDFSLSASSSKIEVNIVAGASTSTDSTITVNSIAGFSSNVSFSATSAITGASYNFTPTVSSSPYSTGIVFNVYTPSTLLSGVYPITVKGIGGGLERTIIVSLNVSTPDPFFKEF